MVTSETVTVAPIFNVIFTLKLKLTQSFCKNHWTMDLYSDRNHLLFCYTYQIAKKYRKSLIIIIFIVYEIFAKPFDLCDSVRSNKCKCLSIELVTINFNYIR